MIPASAVIINHDVLHRGTNAGLTGMKQLTQAALVRKIDYAAREGRFKDKGGLDRAVTDDDMRLTRVKNIVDYGARVGKWENKAVDIPLVPGERSGGIWDQNGVVEHEGLAERIWGSNSNLITSVVTVSREYAANLHMQTKVDFQRVIRSAWTEQVERWGIIKPENIRWTAEFHTDAEKSVHVHMTTWDASGEFTGAAKIPHATLEPANEIVRRAIFGERVSEKNTNKYYLRELAQAKLRVELGQPIPDSTLARLEKLRYDSSFQRHPVSLKAGTGGRSQALKEAYRNAIGVLSPSQKGYMQYGSLPETTRQAIDGLREAVAAHSPGLQKVLSLYRVEASKAAAYKGAGEKYNRADYYINRQMMELNRRLSNIVAKHLAVEKPFNTGKGQSLREIPLATKVVRGEGPQTVSGLLDDRQKHLRPALPEQCFVRLSECVAEMKRLRPGGARYKALLYEARGLVLSSDSMRSSMRHQAALVSGSQGINYRDALRSVYRMRSMQVGSLLMCEASSTRGAGVIGWAAVLAVTSLRPNPSQELYNHHRVRKLDQGLSRKRHVARSSF
jgi:hypothetical protein